MSATLRPVHFPCQKTTHPSTGVSFAIKEIKLLSGIFVYWCHPTQFIHYYCLFYYITVR